MRAVFALIGLGVCLLITALTMPLLAGEGLEGRQFASLAHSPSQTAIERLQAGEIIDCPGCDLRGADLSHTCVKEKNLAGAKFDDAIALYMCMSYANFSGASFRNTDLTGANLAHSDLTGADLTGAKLDIASLKGADLATVKGLTQDQLDTACADEDTKLPAGLKPEFCI
jgi:uncharacterized protein YjbI with pentapeptide repeats